MAHGQPKPCKKPRECWEDDTVMWPPYLWLLRHGPPSRGSENESTGKDVIQMRSCFQLMILVFNLPLHTHTRLVPLCEDG
eukprot:158957-Chlamydomonas_euryale.AAC.1